MLNRPLCIRSLADHAKNIVSWMIGVVSLVVVQLLVYPTIRDSSEEWSGVTQDFPEVLKEMLRMTDYTSETGYLNTELMSFTVPFIFVMMGATWGARVATEDEENGTADIVLSLPVSRPEYMVSRLVAAMAVVLITATAFATTLTVGARVLDLSIPVSRYAAAGISLAVLGLVTLSIAALVGSFTGRRGVSLGLATAVAIAAFVAYSLAPLVDFFGHIESASPFRWTIGTLPLMSGFDMGYLSLGLGVSVLLTLASVWRFGRRDIKV